jgi:hypothetical protein
MTFCINDIHYIINDVTIKLSIVTFGTATLSAAMLSIATLSITKKMMTQ